MKGKAMAKQPKENFICRGCELDENVTFGERRKALKELIKRLLDRFISEKIHDIGKFSRIIGEYNRLNEVNDSEIIIVTGQEVSSFIRSKLFDKWYINGNDLDVFVPVILDNTNNIEALDEYTVSLGFGNSYDIAKTGYINNYIDEPINITYIIHPLYTDSVADDYDIIGYKKLAELVINSFDINIVKVGFVYNMRTKKIDYIITDDFINSLFSGIITPSANVDWTISYGRIFKKVKNMRGLYLDRDIIINAGDCRIKLKEGVKINKSDFIRYNDLLIASSKFCNNNKYLFTNSNYTDPFDDIELPNEFIINDYKRYSEYSDFYIQFCKKYNYHFNLGFKHDTINGSEKVCISIDKDIDESILDDTFILKEFINSIKNDTVYNPHYMELLKNMVKAEVVSAYRSKKKIKVINDYLKKFNLGCILHYSIISEIILNNITSINLDLFNVTKLLNHDEIKNLFIDLRVKLSIDKVLLLITQMEDVRVTCIKSMKLGKELEEHYMLISIPMYYKLFTSDITSKIALQIIVDKPIDSYIDIFRESIKTIIIEHKEKLNKHVLPKEFNKIEYSNNGNHIVELVNNIELEIEGKIMHHCVGGYGTSIENMGSSIFKIYSDNDKSLRYTCEINPFNYNVIQCRGKKNMAVRPEDKAIVDDLIKRVANKMKEQNRSDIVKRVRTSDMHAFRQPQPVIDRIRVADLDDMPF